MDLEMIIGRNWGQRGIILGTAVLYLYMLIFRPKDAWRSLSNGVMMFFGLLTLVFAAILLASAIQVLIPKDLIQKYLGPSAGLRGVLTGGLLAGLLQGGPYAVYPIIKGLQEEGVGLSVVISMLVGYSIIGSGRIVFGLAIFEAEIIAIRVVLGVSLAVLSCVAIYYIFGD
ncbi:MAG: permease [Candidatus Thermoplasmatota archaeon]|nr:permease [Candidatus Thermoplasmatota archaeon]